MRNFKLQGMKITTLTDNVVNNSYLAAEHGLSMYLETDSLKILFDTGQSDLFVKNAYQLGIDLSQTDFLILSHSHYDHTGGLKAFMKINSKATILAKKDIFIPKFSGKTRFIGLEKSSELRERITFIDSTLQLDEQVFILTQIRITYPEDTNFRMFYKKIGISFIPDDFSDELFLVIRRNSRISILTACSHSGISNICETALQEFPLPVHLIAGGFHIRDCSEEQYQFLLLYLRKIKPEMIGTCHCTGVERFAHLVRDLECKVFYNYTGNDITIR
jgi:7,8-dihydropterin-6-yl-methyl-4-(beta-D-ribofuranosyl)aminobenzene 5'-phosphate synthase